MQIEIHESLGEIEQLKPGWDALYEKSSPGFFLHHTWVLENYRLMPPERILLIAAYGERRQLIGVFPFAIEPFRIKWLRYKALVHGGNAMTDYARFMIDPESNRRLMIRRVLRKLGEMQPGAWDLIKLERLNNADGQARLFIELAERELYGASVRTEVTPIIDFSVRYLEAKKLSNIRRGFRKLEPQTTLEFLSGQEITKLHMQEFCAVHQQSFRDSGFSRTEAQEFYRTLIDDRSFGSNVTLALLKTENEFLAGHFGFTDGDAFFYYVPTYNPAYAEYGPGKYLLFRLIEHARERDMRTFHLLRGAEPYKFDWANRIDANLTLLATPKGAPMRRKLLLNAWLASKALPMFSREPDR